jgi:hypothetical protein
VLIASVKDCHFVAEAKGHASHKLPGFPVKAHHCTSLVLVHSRPGRIPPIIRPKVSLPSSPTPSFQDDISIEAMVKGLRPGPTTQYFAWKHLHSLEKLLQKMDEYIRADNDFH